MERAVDYAPFPTTFPVARSSPIWVSHHLQYAMSGAYSTQSSGGVYGGSTTATSENGDGFQVAPKPSKPAPPPPTAPAPPPPPTTPAPPPEQP
jgi:hypothetical protein